MRLSFAGRGCLIFAIRLYLPTNTTLAVEVFVGYSSLDLPICSCALRQQYVRTFQVTLPIGRWTPLGFSFVYSALYQPVNKLT